MNDSKRNELEDEAISRLVTYGVSNVNEINRLTLQSPELRALKDEELTIVVACYAASLAKLTKLDLSALLRIMTGAYLSIAISPLEAPPPTETETEAGKI